MNLNFPLHPKQKLALRSEANEILYGGAAGGGKSYLMRALAITACLSVKGFQVYLFRRLSVDLEKNHIEGVSGLRGLLAPLIECGICKIIKNQVRFTNGSKIHLCHCKDEKNITKYQGAEIDMLLIDEITHFTEVIYRFLRGRVRTTNLEAGRWGGRILVSGNPGGVGHLFVKKMFIDDAEPYAIRQMSKDEGGMKRQFIPARLHDNPTLTKNDPTYEARLSGLGSPELVKAIRDGDWNVVQGAFFSEFATDRHVIPPFAIPENWTRFRSMDWGSAKPFSVGWWAVSDGSVKGIARGALVKYREWYGKKTDNVGLKLHADAVARGIKGMGGYEQYAYSVADPSIFKEDGGPSISEMFRREGVYFTPADNSRVAGWNQIRTRLVGNEDLEPMILFFSTCLDSIRTMPALQHDEHKPEDLDTDAEDHAADENRYACMSRPYVRSAEQKKSNEPRPLTFNDLIQNTGSKSIERYV